MTDHPYIREVVTLISEDNGGHLLHYYGVTPRTPEQVVEKMIEAASEGLDTGAIDAIEAHLASLTSQQREILAGGAEHEAEPLLTPDVSAFLEAAFEADVL